MSNNKGGGADGFDNPNQTFVKRFKNRKAWVVILIGVMVSALLYGFLVLTTSESSVQTSSISSHTQTVFTTSSTYKQFTFGKIVPVIGQDYSIRGIYLPEYEEWWAVDEKANILLFKLAFPKDLKIYPPSVPSAIAYVTVTGFDEDSGEYSVEIKAYHLTITVGD